MKKLHFILLIALAGFFSACDHFDVSNDNPDVALNIDRNPELLLTNFQRNSIRRAVSSSWSEGNLMAQYGARIVFTEFDLFNWGDQSGLWNTFYIAIRDAKELEKIADQSNLPSYKAVAMIMESWMYQIMTDMYGEIPYTQAVDAVSGNYTPEYDTQENIYNSILAQLESANTLLSAQNLPGIKGDLVFNGDLVKWRKFANSLRLRVAMRLSEAKPALAESTIAAIYNDPINHPVMDSNDDNAVLVFLGANPDAHPVTEESVYRVGSYNEYRISETLVGLLEKYNDPRLEFFADPTANSVAAGTPKIDGMKNGIVDGPAYEYKGGDAFLSKFNISFFFYSPNSNEGRLMIYPEVAYIFAEAAQRGWIGGNAKTFYEDGIQASFDYWGLDMPTGYLAQTDVAFTGQMEQIINQKYIALFYTDFQGFIEFKRTGFPTTITPGPDAFYSVYPSRFEYPSKEAVLNGANYDAAVARQGPDEITTKVWWEK